MKKKKKLLVNVLNPQDASSQTARCTECKQLTIRRPSSRGIVARASRS